MKKVATLVFGAVALFFAVLMIKSWGTNEITTTVEKTADGTRVYPESKMQEALDSDEDAIIYLDGREPVDKETIAAMPPCDIVAKVEPPKGSTKRCRTPQGDETLISVYWEDHYMEEPKEDQPAAP